MTDARDQFPANWASESGPCSDKEGLFQIILTTKGSSGTDVAPLKACGINLRKEGAMAIGTVTVGILGGEGCL